MLKTNKDLVVRDGDVGDDPKGAEALNPQISSSEGVASPSEDVSPSFSAELPSSPWPRRITPAVSVEQAMTVPVGDAGQDNAGVP